MLYKEQRYQEPRLFIPGPQPAPSPRRTMWRAASIVAAVAVVLLTIVSWALLSSARQHPTPTVSTTTQVGAQHDTVHSGTLVCSFSDNGSGDPVPVQPSLSWSSSGQVAVTYHNLKIAFARDCTRRSANMQPGAQQASWSPDGKSLLVLSRTDEAQVLDASNGHVIAGFSGNEPGETIRQSVWISNEIVVSLVQKTYGSMLIQTWNAHSGAFMRTALTLAEDTQPLGLDTGQSPVSPDGRYVVVQKSNKGVQVWSIASGKLVNSIPYHALDQSGQLSISALAWSPDGKFLALGLPNAPEVQIWSITSGRMTASFKVSDTWLHIIGALAWSPNGRYLAESGAAIHIWDVKAQKIVATFGRLNKPAYMPTLAWSPDSSMLVSTTNYAAAPGQPELLQNTVRLWKLS